MRLTKLLSLLVCAYSLILRTKEISLLIELERGIFEKILVPSIKSDDQASLLRDIRRTALFLSFIEDRSFATGDVLPEKPKLHVRLGGVLL